MSLPEVPSEPPGVWRSIHNVLLRRKIYFPPKKLNMNLNLYDITGLSLFTALGVTPYYLIGQFVTRMGPGMVLAYLLGAVLTLLSALTLAELTSHGGGSGGAYSTIYLQVGELPAFAVGWLLLARYLVGNAFFVNALAAFIRNTSGFSEDKWITTDNIFFHAEFFSPKLSILGCILSILLTALFILFLSHLKRINNALVAVNLFLFVLVLASTGSVVKVKYWTLPAKEGCGKGGFFPYGLSSIWDNTRLVYIAYVGFDTATFAGGECYEPERVIPIAMLLSTVILFVLYILQSITHSMCWHYCDQNVNQAIVYILKKTGLEVFAAFTLVLIPVMMTGTILAMTYGISRLFYSVAEDGLLFKIFLKTDKTGNHPITSMITAGIVSSVFSLFFSDVQLSEVLSLLAMLSQSVSALCVIYLRHYDIHLQETKKKSYYRKIFNLKPKAITPNKSSLKVVSACCLLLVVFAYPLIYFVNLKRDDFVEGRFLGIGLLILTAIVLGTIYYIISVQPQSDILLTYKIRWHPLVPFSCIILNVFFSLTFDIWTWLRCLSLIGIGLFIYATYGVWNSKQQIRA